MDEKAWALAWARFDSLRENPPVTWWEDEVEKYHKALTLLEQASGEDLSEFRVADSELHHRVSGTRQGFSGIPARTTTSPKRLCYDHVMRQKIEGVVKYFEYRQPTPKGKTYGFSSE